VRPGDYHRMVVTEETPGDPSRGPTVLRGQLRY
jgi:hypothetical protein